VSGLSARQVASATLASLPHITAKRLRRTIEHFGDPVAALEAVLHGQAHRALRGTDDDKLRIGREWCRAADPDAIAAALERRGTHVWVEGDDDFPFTRPVIDQPYVLFAEGAAPGALSRPRAAIVGTRSATPHGLADAAELGAALAAAGATVVSGLAIGIDGAAHEGALRANGEVVGVVATGLDVEYPRRHKTLYQRVRAQGVVVSEHWFGVRPDRVRFPVRNRIIAALCDVLVVVEATQTGGARITADAAARYDRPVLAMPGSRRNPAATGCNELLRDGAEPLLDPSDVLQAIELTFGGRAQWARPSPPPESPSAKAVLRALGGEPATVDDLIVRTRLSAADTITAVRDLETSGAVHRQRGFVWPR
jgi:DNA processing protein